MLDCMGLADVAIYYHSGQLGADSGTPIANIGDQWELIQLTRETKL